MTDHVDTLPGLLERVNEYLSGWCRCICREHPDGTMCKLCGHSHEAKNDV